MAPKLTPSETHRLKEHLAQETKEREAATPAYVPGKPIKVRALKLGFYNNLRRREGDVFTLKDSKQFSKKWMVEVPASTPNRVTTGNQEIKRQHDETIGQVFGKNNVPVPESPNDGDGDPGDGPDPTRATGDEGDNPLDA